jgi:hypothetical protein
MNSLQMEVVQVQQEYMKKMQDLHREGAEAGIKLQQDSMIKYQKLAEESIVEQQKLQKELEEAMKNTQKDIEKIISQKLTSLFEPDPKFKNSKVTEQQMKDFVKNGFVKVQNVIPPDVVQAARKIVKYLKIIIYFSFSLSQGFTTEELLLFRRPEFEASEQILALLNKSPAIWLARSMIGETHPCYGGQVIDLYIYLSIDGAAVSWVFLCNGLGRYTKSI